MRLIDADAFEKQLNDERFDFWTIKEIRKTINEQPTIDPVKHGMWIVIPQRCKNQEFDECKCSVCGTVEYFNSGWKKFSYCPNCGARMDKEDSNGTV